MTINAIHEPAPLPGKEIVLPHVIRLVEQYLSRYSNTEIIEDLTQRAEMGRQKYGTYLETQNGRNPLVDAYQEALDLLMYLEQRLLETPDRTIDNLLLFALSITHNLKVKIIEERRFPPKEAK